MIKSASLNTYTSAADHTLLDRETSNSPEHLAFEQAGGHDGAFIASEKGTIIKKACERERQFYHGLVNHLGLQVLCPKFLGEHTFGEAQGIEISNLTIGYTKPSVVDIKMGTRTWGRDASEAKRKLASTKDNKSTSATFGFRLCALRIYDVSQECFTKNLKRIGDENSSDRLFFLFRDFQVDVQTLSQVIEKIRIIRSWFENNHELRFIASSLLLVYEGESKTSAIKPPTLTMIDFAHVEPIIPEEDGEDRDEGYLLGLNSLEKIFVDLCK